VNESKASRTSSPMTAAAAVVPSTPRVTVNVLPATAVTSRSSLPISIRNPPAAGKADASATSTVASPAAIAAATVVSVPVSTRSPSA